MLRFFLLSLIGLQVCFAEVVVQEYKLAARVDERVLADRKTELWASVHRPDWKQSSLQKHPLLVFLHGNHSTCGTGENPRQDRNCQYTRSGTCPEGYVVVPNHRGYDYLAEAFAKKGFIVVSINANRGINCGNGATGDWGLNLARGALVLRHLEKLSLWNSEGGSLEVLGVDLKGRIDFSQVGLMGHSRGGEGMRAAYQFYRESAEWKQLIRDEITFRGLFEIAPVDGQTRRTLNAIGIPWNVLLPLCDGDVRDLQGINVYDRKMNRQIQEKKTQSVYTVWGANHNFYNTEWQKSDSSGCTDHEPLWTQENGGDKQRLTSLYSMQAFFNSFMGRNRSRDSLKEFNPLYPIAWQVAEVTNVDRAFVASLEEAKSWPLEDFDQPTGKNSHGYDNSSKGIELVHGSKSPFHKKRNHGALLSWEAGEGEKYLLINFSQEGVRTESYNTLDFDLSRSQAKKIETPINFFLQVVNIDGTFSQPVELKEITTVLGPVGGPFNRRHYFMSTARIPLSRFAGMGERIRGLKLSFEAQDADSLYLANFRLAKNMRDFDFYTSKPRRLNIASALQTHQKALKSCRYSIKNSNTDNEKVVSLSSQELFLPQGSLLTLFVNGKAFSHFKRPQDGSLEKVDYVLPSDVFDTDGPLTIHVGHGPQQESIEYHCQAQI